MTITSAQKQYTRDRASDCCEYCRVAQSSSFTRFQVDHIIAVKHGGSDEENNLCLACYKCNIYKGSNIAALDPDTGDATKLFNPRQQKWDEHFTFHADGKISGLTPEGRTTILVLRINDEIRVKQRKDEIAVGNYPCK